MTRTSDGGRTDGLSVTDLFANYLKKQIDAHAAGVGHAEPAGDAEPHEATPIQPIDPALAWKDAIAPAKFAGAQIAFDAPPDWPSLVGRQGSAVALALALGNFPQLVRNLHVLLASDAVALRDLAGEAAEVTGLAEWAGTKGERRLLAAGLLRLGRQFDAAEAMLNFVPSAEERKLYANEAAALLWHRGEAEKALAMWEGQPDGAAALFNRGMARLFVGRAADAVEPLTAAMAMLPETGAWHHLAALYLALARR